MRKIYWGNMPWMNEESEVFHTFSLRISSPDCGGEDVTIGGSENSGSVKVSGCESETASLELSSLIRSLPTPPWSRKIQAKCEKTQFPVWLVLCTKNGVTNTWSSMAVGQKVFRSCNEKKKQGCKESKQQSKSRIIVCICGSIRATGK